MTTEISSTNTNGATPSPSGREQSSRRIAVAGLLAWMAMSMGFLGLKLLMQQRPQFAGQPLRFSKTEMVQESPQIMIRKVSDDIAATRLSRPEWSDVQCHLNGRRDYRGLRTILDMSGEFQARYRVTNTFAEPIFVLFKCLHPRTDAGPAQTLLAR